MYNDPNKTNSTSDKAIRLAFRKILHKEVKEHQKSGHNFEIFEEFAVGHGVARIDFAIINGIMHGIEIKSDRDNLKRLPEQVKEFSSVFDKITLIVAKRHLYQAIHIIPEWWGIKVVKKGRNDELIFLTIRSPENNVDQQVKISIARLLWREEALRILYEQDKINGVKYKSREIIYNRLVNILDIKNLKQTVSTFLISRQGWQSGQQLELDDG